MPEWERARWGVPRSLFSGPSACISKTRRGKGKQHNSRWRHFVISQHLCLSFGGRGSQSHEPDCCGGVLGDAEVSLGGEGVARRVLAGDGSRETHLEGSERGRAGQRGKPGTFRRSCAELSSWDGTVPRRGKGGQASAIARRPVVGLSRPRGRGIAWQAGPRAECGSRCGAQQPPVPRRQLGEWVH